jgi:hypothetical protein
VEGGEGDHLVGAGRRGGPVGGEVPHGNVCQGKQAFLEQTGEVVK